MRKALFLLALPALLLYADATKTTFSRTKMAGGLVTTEITSTADFRANMKADDDNTKMQTIISGKPQHNGKIVRLDKELIWDISHDNKTYTEGPLKPPVENVKVDTRTQNTPDTVQRYRVVSSEFSVKKLDSTKTINDFPCTGYLAVWSLTVEEIATKNRTTSTMTLNEWTTPKTDVITQAEAEEAAFNKAYLAKLGLNVEPEKAEMMGMAYLMTLGVNQQEFAAKMQSFSAEMAKIQGYPIVTDVKWTVADSSKPATQVAEPEREPEKGKFGLPNIGGIINNKIADKVVPRLNEAQSGPVFSAYVEVKAISAGAVPDGHFTVPEGYRMTGSTAAKASAPSSSTAPASVSPVIVQPDFELTGLMSVGRYAMTIPENPVDTVRVRGTILSMFQSSADKSAKMFTLSPTSSGARGVTGYGFPAVICVGSFARETGWSLESALKKVFVVESNFSIGEIASSLRAVQSKSLCKSELADGGRYVVYSGVIDVAVIIPRAGGGTAVVPLCGDDWPGSVQK